MDVSSNDRLDEALANPSPQWSGIVCRLEDSIIRSDCLACGKFREDSFDTRSPFIGLNHLLLAVESACRSCVIIYLTLRHFNAPKTTQEQEYYKVGVGHGSIGLFVMFRNLGGSRDTNVNLYVEPNEDDEVFVMTYYGLDDLLPLTVASSLSVDSKFLYPWKSNSAFSLTGGSDDSIWGKLKYSSAIDRDPSSVASFRKISAWLSCCLKEHPICSSGPTSLPTRVIDVGEFDGRTPCRLYETKRESANYIALSHCWGPPDLIYKTTSSTLESNKHELPWNKLSKTFQEAIAMTRRLGVRYLWIDSLCIIQDSPKDWDIEAANMGNVYKNAYLTLAATASSSGAGGLFVARDDEFLDIPLPQLNTQSGTAILRARHQRKHPLQQSSTANQSRSKPDPLACRAWVYQERLLARRTLHFSSEELLWECRTASTCECGHASGVEENPKSAFEKLTLHNAETKDETSWCSLVSAYTQLQLTYSADRLPALSGIASQLFQESNYLAGLSREFLLRELGWCVHPFSKAQPVSRQLGAPSWSWASLNAPILWETFNFQIANNLRIIEVSCKSEGENPFGRVSDAYLIISGTGIEATLLPTSRIDKDDTPRWRYGGQLQIHQKYLVDNNSFIPDCASAYGSDILSQPVLLLICSRNFKSSNWCTQAMVLRKVKLEDASYERMGIVNLYHHTEHSFDDAGLCTVKIV